MMNWREGCVFYTITAGDLTPTRKMLIQTISRSFDKDTIQKETLQMKKKSLIFTIAITLLLSVFMTGCSEDEADVDTLDETDVESLYKELVGTYDLFKSEVSEDGAKLVVEPPKVAGTMTISSDQKITMKLQVLETSGFTTGSFEIRPDEGVMSIDYETVDVISKATFAYTWDGEILTITVDAGTYVGTHFWRKLNNSVIDLQPPELETEPPPPSAAFVSANPPSGSKIAANATVTLTFDNAPADVTVSAGFLAGSGKTLHVAGPFPPGPLVLTVTWAGGSVTLIYIVVVPDVEPPLVTGATVSDGEKDVDPAAINEDRIEITFSEEVTGNIVLQTEDGHDVGWIGKVDGDKATLEPVKGKEIDNETTYVIKCRVADAAGNVAEISITFVTRAKE